MRGRPPPNATPAHFSLVEAHHQVSKAVVEARWSQHEDVEVEKREMEEAVTVHIEALEEEVRNRTRWDAKNAPVHMSWCIGSPLHLSRKWVP
jgi:hypothetical protein